MQIRSQTGMAALLAVVALTAGCTRSQEPAPSTETTPLEQVADTPAPDDPDSSDDDSGQMVVTYEDATTPEAIRGRRLMQDSRLLEDLAGSVNDSFKLPYDIPLVGSQCDEANDYWSSSDQEMTMCYEDVDESIRIFTDAGDPDADATARRIGVASFYHELGHMAIDVYDLPATGREEDVADQMSAFVLLSPDDDGNVDPDSVQAAKDLAREFKVYSEEYGAPDEAAFADSHTLDGARTYNFECWIYGSNPEANGDIITDGLLPDDRADGCEDEFDRLSNAWSTLLEPHFK